MAHQASFQVEELPSQSLPPTSKVIFILEEEYNHLLSLQSNSVGSSSTATLAHHGTSTTSLATQDPWVIDSSATNHMTSTSSLLSDLEHSSNLPNVTLADGSAIIVYGLGTANLSPNLSLSSILYIPDFSFNLLSISKLTKILNCAAILFSTHCIFQDLKTRKIIGGGHEADGLYYLDRCGSSRLVASHLSISPLQHHCHLGHPSLKNLKSLVPSCRQIESLQCEAC